MHRLSLGFKIEAQSLSFEILQTHETHEVKFWLVDMFPSSSAEDFVWCVIMVWFTKGLYNLAQECGGLGTCDHSYACWSYFVPSGRTWTFSSSTQGTQIWPAVPVAVAEWVPALISNMGRKDPLGESNGRDSRSVPTIWIWWRPLGFCFLSSLVHKPTCTSHLLYIAFA